MLYQTLAHYTDEAAGGWVETLQSINGLLHLAAHNCIGELKAYGSRMDPEISTERELHSILYTLIEVYETLRQCEVSFHVSSHMQYRYAKSVKSKMKEEWEQRLAQLTEQIGEQVMSMVRVHDLHLNKPSSSERVLLSLALANNHEQLSGALALKVANFSRRTARTAVGGPARDHISFFHISASNLLVKNALSGSMSNVNAQRGRRVVFTLKTTSQDDLGLKWEIFNSSQPLVGDEIDNATLAAALEQQYNDNKQNPEILPENAGFLSLSRDELAAMEVESISHTSFIKAGTQYFTVAKTGTTLIGNHIVNPTWLNEQVQFSYISGRDGEPLKKGAIVEVKVIDESGDGERHVLGTAEVALDEPFTKYTAKLVPTDASDAEKAGSQSDGNDMTVSFYYRVGQFMPAPATNQ